MKKIIWALFLLFLYLGVMLTGKEPFFKRHLTQAYDLVLAFLEDLEIHH